MYASASKMDKAPAGRHARGRRVWAVPGLWLGRSMESKGFSIGPINREGTLATHHGTTPCPRTRKKETLRWCERNGILLVARDNPSSNTVPERSRH